MEKLTFLGFGCQSRRWPEKFNRLRKAASLIEKETLPLGSSLPGVNLKNEHRTSNIDELVKSQNFPKSTS